MASNIDEYEFTLEIDLPPEITTQNNENIEITTLSPINEHVEQSNRENSSYSPRHCTPSSSLSSDDDYDEMLLLLLMIMIMMMKMIIQVVKMDMKLEMILMRMKIYHLIQLTICNLMFMKRIHLKVGLMKTEIVVLLPALL